jgi:ethanolamine permease
MTPAEPSTIPLRRTLGPWTLWGLGVGYVISGEYFGWNLGLPLGGIWGMAVAFVLVTAMYIAFVFSYTELACAMPRAGGGFVYALRGLGRPAGFFTGFAQLVEFVFAPPAIAMALGAYVQTWWPDAEPKWVAIGSLAVFTALNIWGVKQAATFELVITLLAVGELLLFSAVTAPAVKIEHFAAASWGIGWTGVLAALPFAVWFYLAIEGVANAAEEAVHPQRDVAIGFGAALATLVLLAAAVFVCGVGVGGWERIVWAPEDLITTEQGLAPRPGAAMSDRPLPLALAQVYPATHPLYQLLIGIGALGIICSLNGIILAAGRALLEMGRTGFAPRILGWVHATTQAPAAALCANFIVGAASILLFDTGALITLSAMGAVTLYVLSMEALVRLRTSAPDMPRPFRTPWYPVFPRVAQLLSAVVLGAMLWQNLAWPRVWASATGCYIAMGLGAALYYLLFARAQRTPKSDAAVAPVSAES